jgi:hypothetical protein
MWKGNFIMAWYVCAGWLLAACAIIVVYTIYRADKLMPVVAVAR